MAVELVLISWGSVLVLWPGGLLTLFINFTTITVSILDLEWFSLLLCTVLLNLHHVHTSLGHSSVVLHRCRLLKLLLSLRVLWLGLTCSRAICESSGDLLRWLCVLVLEEPIRVLLLWIRHTTLQVLGVRPCNSEVLGERGLRRHHNHRLLVNRIWQRWCEARLVIYDVRHRLVVVTHSGVALPSRCCVFWG